MTIAIDLVFDGIGHGVLRAARPGDVSSATRAGRSGDDMILDLVSEAAMEAAAGRRPRTASSS